MSRKKILIVDDEIIIARELETRLSTLGYEIVGIAGSGAEAVALASETRPDLVLMDIMLRGSMDGIDAAALIRENQSVPVIYVTAFTDAKTLDRAKLTEPYGYVVKPFSEHDLRANIEMALYKHGSEARLRKIERWFAGSINQVTDAVVVADENGFVDYLNHAATAITGWPSSDARGLPLSSVLRLRDSETDAPVSVAEALEAGTVVVTLADETLLETRTGARLRVDCTTTAVRDERHRPCGTVSVLRDVSGQISGSFTTLMAEVAAAIAGADSMQAMLQECAESCVRALKVAAVRIWTLSPGGDMLLMRASAGMSTHLDGPDNRVVVGESNLGRIAQQHEALVSNHVPDDPRIGESDWARRAGMQAFAGIPLLVDECLVGVLGLCSRHPLHEDLVSALNPVADTLATGIDRKQAESALRDSEERLHAILNAALDSIVTMDHKGTIVSVNAATQRLFGYTEEELLGQNVKVLMPSPYHEEHDGYLSRYARTGEKKIIGKGREVTAQRKDRSIFPIYLTVGEFQAGGAAGFSGFIHDLSEEHALRDQMTQAQKMEAVGTLTSGVAHDFNNLLAGIIGAAEQTLKAVPQGDLAAKHAAQIRDAALGGASIVKQLMAVGSKRPQTVRVIELDTALGGTESMLRRLIGQDIDFEVRLSAPDAHVRCGAGHIEQILMNLVVNARHAMPHGGRLRLESKTQNVTAEAAPPDMEPGRWATFSITDTGEGMDAETRARIFEPFFTTKEQGKGTGLGLSTVFAQVKQANGRITVSSEPGSGTTFTIDLPCAAESVVALPTSPVLKVGRGQTILVVDDEWLVCMTVSEYLKCGGYHVLSAATGDEAMKVLATHGQPVDLVLSDMVLPGGLAGPDIVALVKESSPAVQSMFMSAHSNEWLIEEGRLPVGVESLQKPFSEEELLASVSQALRAQTSLVIAVIDDHEDLRELTRALLESWGHVVHEADTGLEGIALVVEKRPDLAIIDIGLPDIKGYEVARQIRSQLGDACPPLIAMSGYSQPADHQRSKEAGFDLHLSKPVKSSELRDSLHWRPESRSNQSTTDVPLEKVV